MDKQWTKAIFVKSKNPQTAIFSHMWDCAMVTRTGIELTEQIFVISSKMRKTPKNSRLWAFALQVIYSNFKSFLTTISGKQVAEYEHIFKFERSKAIPKDKNPHVLSE